MEKDSLEKVIVEYMNRDNVSRVAGKPGHENPFAESDFSDIFDGDGISKRVCSPSQTQVRFLRSSSDWLKILS